jgi:NAD(P)H dehydrogenase (quinone)
VIADAQLVLPELPPAAPRVPKDGVTGAAGDGRISAAARADYVEAVAAVLNTGGHPS